MLKKNLQRCCLAVTGGYLESGPDRGSHKTKQILFVIALVGQGGFGNEQIEFVEGYDPSYL